MNFRWEIIQEYAPLFMEGAWMTIKCTIICVLLGTTWGLILGLGRLAQAPHGIWKPILHYGVQWPVRIYISAFRGTPLFVQIMVVHFALVPLFINPRDGLLVTSGLMSVDFARALRADYGAFLSCVVAITLNAGAYVSEIFRAGIQSIDRGQMEASRSLGMSYGKTMRQVILPQAFRRMLPPLGNNAIAIVKDSSLASAIGLADLAYAAPSGAKPRSSTTTKSSGLAFNTPVLCGRPCSQVRFAISMRLFLNQQGDRFARDALAAPGEAELLGGRGLHVDVIHMALQIFRQEDAHLRDVRRHFRRLSDNRDIEVTEAVSFGADTFPGFAQQLAAVRALESRIGIGEQLADITQRRSAQQGVGRGVQRNVAVGMGQQTFVVRDANATDHQRAFAAEFMYVKTVTDTHGALLNCLTESNRTPPAPNPPAALL